MVWSFVSFETGRKKSEGCTVIKRFASFEEAAAFRKKYFDDAREELGEDFYSAVFWDGYKDYDIIPESEEW